MRLKPVVPAIAALLVVPMFLAPAPDSLVAAPSTTYPCACHVWTPTPTNGWGQTAAISPGVLAPQVGGTQCQNACYAAASNLAPAAVAMSACLAGGQNGQQIQAYSWATGIPVTIGQPNPNGPKPAFNYGNLKKTPGVTKFEWICPAAWLSNTSNQPGGTTTDQRCKKKVGILSVTPYPANGTQIGSWGFTWYNEVYAYGTSANGGAAVYTNVSTPMVCTF